LISGAVSAVRAARELPRRWELPYDFRKLNKRE